VAVHEKLPPWFGTVVMPAIDVHTDAPACVTAKLADAAAVDDGAT